MKRSNSSEDMVLIIQVSVSCQSHIIQRDRINASSKLSGGNSSTIRHQLPSNGLSDIVSVTRVEEEFSFQLILGTLNFFSTDFMSEANKIISDAVHGLVNIVGFCCDFHTKETSVLERREGNRSEDEERTFRAKLNASNEDAE